MNIEILTLPKIEDYRGNIAVVEKETIPFPIKRVYYLFDVPSNAKRGGHAHKTQFELLIPVSGSFDVQLNNGTEQKTVTLNKPDKGLLIKSNVWRELDNFSSGAVCLVISSGEFDEDDYIRDFDSFLTFLSNTGQL